MYDFSKRSCEDFVKVLASREPVPGGGGAAALVGALGAALGNMVCSLTLGKKKYADVQEDIVRIQARADVLQQQLLTLIARDAEVFEPLSRAYGLPKETDAERAHKAAVMEEALQGACAVPMEMMQRCCEAVELLEELGRIGSALAISDVGCGVACCRAALTGGSLNVFINTKSMTDRACADALNAKANAMLEKYVPLCDAIFEQVAQRFHQ